MKSVNYLTIILIVLTLVFSSCHKKKYPNHNSSISYPHHLTFPKEKIDLADTELKNIIKKVDSCFAKKRDSAGFNGCMLVAYKGNIIYENYCGVEDIVTKKPINKHSIFQIASTSKTFTASAVLYLYQNGMLNINDTLGKYFKDFPYKNIRICDLLSHRSGLPNYLHFINDMGYDTMSLLTNTRLLDILYHQKPEILAFPDTKFAYNNTNYALLALIVEKVSNTDFATFLQKAFFKPCKMNHTFLYQPERKVPKPTTTGYLHRNMKDTIVPTDGIYGDKNIYSTLHDMLQWDKALRSGKLLHDSILTMAYTPRSFENPGIKNYGYGWRLLQQPDSSYLIFHNGWWHGYTSAFYRNTQKDITIIALSNKFTRTTYKVQEIWDAFLGNGNVTMEED
jgi:CubicO group peptidase (beta-lactamase class C family)